MAGWRRELDRTGACNLQDFLTPAGARELAAEAEAMLPQAYERTFTVNFRYRDQVDPDLPASHPERRFWTATSLNLARSIGRTNALFGKSIESPQVVDSGRQLSLRGSVGGHRAVIGPGGSGEFPHISASGDFSRHRHDGDRAASLGFAASQWHEVDQPNKQLWGGARDRGKRALAVQGSLLSRWVRIFSITTGSSMQAMILTAAQRTPCL